MFAFYIAALIFSSSSCLAVDLDSDANVYDAIVQSLEELKARQSSEDIGVQYAESNDGDTNHRTTSVCYDELGCFDKNGTFKHLKQLPEPPETINTKFLLYTQKNVHTPQFLDYQKPETILNSNLDPKLPLKFITHGFGGKNNITWVWQMKNAFLEKENVNVIIIDWSLGARAPYYIGAAVNSELVGAQLAVLYFMIKDHLDVEEKDLHIIGFSLGAHVAGFAGKRMQEARGTRPGRITGLDAASPLFEEYGPQVHLDKEDADFVDVVHTNADILLYGGLGLEKPVGHVDYYPNGGKRQPGCGSTIKGAFTDVFKGERERACNHERAVLLFTDSILSGDSSCKYVGYHCDSYEDFEAAKCMSCNGDCGQMGYHSKGSGVYFLKTKAKIPFCAEIAELTVQFPATVKKSFGSLILTLVGENDEKENITLSEKDEKLKPGDKKLHLVALNEIFKPLKAVQVLYLKYNGWFAKGTDTFMLESVIIKDTHGKTIFNACEEDIVLNDNEYITLNQTVKAC